MRLHGLSASMWNGCIVDVGKRSESDATRYSCEVVLGENQGKLLAIKSDNLMDIPALTAEEYACAKVKYDSFIHAFEATHISGIEELMNMADEVITAIPNDCSIWHLFAKFCELLY